jgi:UrcA family protein
VDFYSRSVASLWLTAMTVVTAPSVGRAESLQARVSIADLDLKTSAGQLRARERILAVARRLCDRFGNPSRVADRETRAGCVREAANHAIKQLDQASR